MSIGDEILLDVGPGSIKTYLGGDSHENFDEVRNPVYDFNAMDWNKAVKLLQELHNRLRTGNVVLYHFLLTTTPVGATTELKLSGSTTTFALPFKDATIVGMTAAFGSVVTNDGGGIQVRAKKDTSVTSMVATFNNGEIVKRVHQLPGDRGVNDLYDASAFSNIKCDVVVPGGVTWGGSDALDAFLYLSIGEEEGI